VIDDGLTGLFLLLQKQISEESSTVSRDSELSPCFNSKSSSTVQHLYAWGYSIKPPNIPVEYH